MEITEIGYTIKLSRPELKALSQVLDASKDKDLDGVHVNDRIIADAIADEIRKTLGK